MVIQAFVFYLFATVVIASGVMTIASRNPVHSVLWLILASCWSSSTSGRSRSSSCSSS
jgi:NADH:ubiquinone oxidoreductase subunit 6 (subunit J)